MANCKNCGVQLADNAAFCPTCGTPVAREQEAQLQVSVQAGQEAPGTGVPAGAADQKAMEGNAQPEAGVQYQNGQSMNGGVQYQNGQPMNGGVQYQNGQPMNGGVQYQNGQPMNGGAQYQNGQPMNGGAQYQNGQPIYNGAPYQNPYNQSGVYGYPGAAVPKPNNNKKVGIIACVLILAILAVAGVIIFKVFAGGGKGYESAVKTFMKGIENQSAMEMAQSFPSEMREELYDEILGSAYSEEEFWENFNWGLENACGANVKMSYSIGRGSQCDKEEIEDFEDELSWYYDYDCTITDAYLVQVNICYKGSLDSYEESVYITVAKIKGKWYVIGV